MKIKNRLKTLQKMLTFFDYALIAFFVLSVIVFAFIFFRKPVFIDVKIKVSEDGLIWPKPGSVDWYADLFYQGMKEKDGAGNVQAEVLDVYSYKLEPNKKAVYLTVRLRSVYTKSLDQYSYKGKPLLIGYPIKLNLNEVGITGLIVQLGETKEEEKTTLILETTVNLKEDRIFHNTTGTYPYIAESVSIGDVVVDNRGESLIEVVGKKVDNSRMLVTTDDGRVLVRNNPFLVDLDLSLKVHTKKVGDRYYFMDDIPILVGEKIPVNFSNVSVFPEITKITPFAE